MRFKTWIESENSLNGRIPEIFPPNRGTSTPASDMVRRTGLQPQVGSNEIQTDAKDSNDKLLAIDAMLQRVDHELPKTGSDKIAKFKNLWKSLRQKWEDLKVSDEYSPQEIDTNGLASAAGDEKFMQYMQNNPNAVPTGPNQASNFAGVA
jgi:hypothetical protein